MRLQVGEDYYEVIRRRSGTWWSNRPTPQHSGPFIYLINDVEVTRDSFEQRFDAARAKMRESPQPQPSVKELTNDRDETSGGPSHR